MALFGKKKKPEQDAPQTDPMDDIEFADNASAPDDIADTDDDAPGQTIDFDSIAADLNADDGSSLDDVLSAPVQSQAPMQTSSAAGAPNDEAFATDDAFINGDTLADDGVPVVEDTFAADDAFASGASAQTDEAFDLDATFGDTAPAAMTGENPFGGADIDIEPVDAPVAAVPDAAVPATIDSPLLYAPPMLSTATVAGGGPVARRSLPLLPLLGAAALLALLAGAGWWVFGRPTAVDDTTVPATTIAATSDAPAGTNAVTTTVAQPGALTTPGDMAVNPGIAVDGVVLAPGPIVQTAPLGTVPPAGTRTSATTTTTTTTTATASSAMMSQLKALWNKGAAAKKAGNYAGARSAWQQMLQLDPGHAGVQEAIDKLPAR